MKIDDELRNKVISLAKGGYLPRETLSEIMKNSLLQEDYFLDKCRADELNDLIGKIEILWNPKRVF